MTPEANTRMGYLVLVGALIFGALAGIGVGYQRAVSSIEHPAAEDLGKPPRPDSLVREAELDVLRDRVSKLEEGNEKLRAVLIEIGTAGESIADIQIDGAFAKYQDIGHFWQATSLHVTKHSQGGMVKGEIMNRLYVVRSGVDITAALINDSGKVIGSGSGVIASAPPGAYTDFSVLVRTDRPLSEAAKVRLDVDDDSGTTSQVPFR